MSEKRFELTKINPTVNLSDTVYFIIDYENPNKEIRTLKDCVDLLNEQQATINEQKEAIEYLKTVIRYIIPNQMVADVFKEIGEEYE